jgi:hypothetical protein
MGKMSPAWKRLAADWSQIEEAFLDEVGLDWCLGRKLHAEKTFSLMKQAIQE